MVKEWLRGKTVIICGSANGIGKYLVYNLIVQYNCKVIGIDIDEISLSNLKTKLNEIGENYEYYCFDAKSENNWIKLAETLKENNEQVDVLINAIGISPKFNNFNKYSLKETNNIFATNLYSCIFAVKHLYDNLKQSRCPSIINICCSSANMGIAGTSIYSASKSALKCYTEVMQQELKGFYVGLLILGLVKTDFWKNQEDVLKNKINSRAMAVSLAAERIVKCIVKKKKRAVVGFDAYLTDRMIRLMPTKARSFINKYLSRKKYRFIDDENEDVKN